VAALRLAMLAVAVLVACVPESSTNPGHRATTTDEPMPVGVTAVDRVPRDCAFAGALWPQNPDPWTTAYGTRPVWIRNMGTVGAAQRPAMAVYPTSQQPTTLGYGQKVLWIIEPGFAGAITITARYVSTGKSLYMQAGTADPSVRLVLDPQHPGVPGSGDPEASNPQLRYAEFPTEMFIAAAGCVEVNATWSSGRWSGTIAVGRGD